jgi:ribonuclease Z
MSFSALTFLGTNSGMPCPYRNVSSSCLSFLNGEVWMFDCGEATQHQLLKCKNVSVGNIEKIFITHLHGDHIYGLPGLICSISAMKKGDNNDENDNNSNDYPNFSKSSKYLEIYGPKNLAKYIRTTFDCSQVYLNFKYRVNEIIPFNESPDNNINLYHCEAPPNYIFVDENGCYDIFENNITVKAGYLVHPIFCVGYSIQESKTVGKLNMQKVNELKVPKGKLLSELKSGKTISFDLDQNKVIVSPDQVLDPPLPGRKLVILGDTCNSEKISQISMNSDWLVHEATLLNCPAELASERGHSTAYMAGKFAASINTKTLILTHFGSKFMPRDKDPTDMNNMIIESTNGYNEISNCSPNIITAEDFLVVNMNRKREQ